MIGLVFDVDDTLYEQIVPFENAYKRLFDMDIDLEQFYLLSRHYSDVKFEASRNGEMTMDEYHIYRIQEAARDLGVLITDEQALDMQKEYKKNQQKLQMSNTTIGILWSKVKALGVERWIDKENIIVSGDYSINKPDVRIFEIMQEKLQLPIDSLYYIGDSLENDIVGANNAGWKSIWINRYKRKLPANVYICKIVENNDELFEIITEIFEK